MRSAFFWAAAPPNRLLPGCRCRQQVISSERAVATKIIKQPQNSCCLAFISWPISSLVVLTCVIDMWQFYLVLIMVVEDDAPGLENRLNNLLHKLNKAFFPAEQFYLTVSISRAGRKKIKFLYWVVSGDRNQDCPFTG
jgi:hypothetical protein